MYVCAFDQHPGAFFFYPCPSLDGPLSSGIIHVFANRVKALIKHLLPFMPSTSSHALPPQRGRKVNLSPLPPPPKERFHRGRRPLKWFESVLVARTLMTRNTMIHMWKSCKSRASVTRRSQKWLLRRKGNLSLINWSHAVRRLHGQCLAFKVSSSSSSTKVKILCVSAVNAA